MAVYDGSVSSFTRAIQFLYAGANKLLFPGDGDVFRAQVDIGLMVRSWDEVVEQEPDLVARVRARR